MKAVTLSFHQSQAYISLFGGMTTATFYIDSRYIDPFYQNPWGEVETDPFLAHLKGDFFCIPFGIAPQGSIPEWGRQSTAGTRREYPHGYSSNGIYRVAELTENRAVLELDFDDPDIRSVTRIITLYQTHIDILDTVYPRRAFIAPVGLHPIFSMPEATDSCLLSPAACEEFLSYPIAVDGSSVFLPGAAFPDLAHTPLKGGGTLNARSLPLPLSTEEVLFAVNVTQGRCTLFNRKESYEVTLSWDKTVLPHCMFWLSNRGRKANPWNGRNLCLGIEPVVSAFDFGAHISTGNNPLLARGRRTYAQFTPGSPVCFAHAVSVHVPKHSV